MGCDLIHNRNVQDLPGTLSSTRGIFFLLPCIEEQMYEEEKGHVEF